MHGYLPDTECHLPGTEPRMNQLRDLTDGPRALPVEVVWSPVYEVLAAMWAMSDKQHLADNEFGHEFLDSHLSMMDVDQRVSFDKVSQGAGVVWLTLLGRAGTMDVLTPEAFVTALRDWDATGLRTSLLCFACDLDPEQIETAVKGDAAAVREILDDIRAKKPAKSGWADGVEALLAEPPGTVRDWAADLLEYAFSELFVDHLARFGPALASDAEATRALIVTMSSEQLIEHATNGISYTPQPGDTSYRLVPSAVVRPWTVMMEEEGARAFIYPVGEEFLDADPDSPPAWVVSVYKALADERRLRVLRRLAESPTSLGDLATHIGVAKSTMHHHVGVLRRAGLIRVSIGASKDPGTYSLRPGVFPEVDRMLAGYLTPIRKDQT